MNKKKLSLVLMLMLLFIAPLATGFLTTTSSTVYPSIDLDVSILRQEPMPAQPGQYVRIFVQVENKGINDAENVAIRIPTQYPFTTTGGNEDLRVLGRIKGFESKIYTFDLAIDSNAPTGINHLDIEYTNNYNNPTWIKIKKPIHIQSTDAGLSISKVERNPYEFVPGEQGNLLLTIKNTAGLTARNIQIQTILADGQGRELPFIPESSTQQRIPILAPEELAMTTISLKTNPTANPGFYKLPVRITFYTDDAEQYVQDDIIGVIIKAKPQLDIFVEESRLAKINTPARVSLQFVNKGISDIKFLEVHVQPSENYELYSQPRRYIGDLDSDDYRSEQYTIELFELTTDLNVEVSYKDANNNEFKEIINIPLACCSYNEVKNNSTSTLIIIIILLIGGYIAYRFYKKKHKKKKNI